VRRRSIDAPHRTAALLAALTLALPAFAVESASPNVAAAQALSAGEADRALALLASPPASGPDAALAHNLICRVRFTLEQFDLAAAECEQAVKLDPQNSNFHLWLGRALGERAARASFLSAFGLAKRTRGEFEEAVRLDPGYAEALSSLGEFDRQAPGIVGGGVDKAVQIAAQLDKVDPTRAHDLRAKIAEQQKDFAQAESEFKQEAAGPHPAAGWAALAGFYLRRQRSSDAESAMHNVLSAAAHDRRGPSALYDAAGELIEANRDPALAASMLEQYLKNSPKTEEAPAFIAHSRLASLRQQLGDTAAAAQERAAALALAHTYKPAPDRRPPDVKQE